jgi:hypothetical protein
MRSDNYLSYRRQATSKIKAPPFRFSSLARRLPRAQQGIRSCEIQSTTASACKARTMLRCDKRTRSGPNRVTYRPSRWPIRIERVVSRSLSTDTPSFQLARKGVCPFSAVSNCKRMRLQVRGRGSLRHCWAAAGERLRFRATGASRRMTTARACGIDSRKACEQDRGGVSEGESYVTELDHAGRPGTNAGRATPADLSL